MKPHAIKTTRNFVMKLFALVFILILIGGCSDDYLFPEWEPQEPTPVSMRPADADFEKYKISSKAETIEAFDQTISIDIPENSVLESATLEIHRIVTAPDESLILSPLSYAISLCDAQLIKPIRIQINYDPLDLDCFVEQDEIYLKIFSCNSSFDSNQGFLSDFSWTLNGENCSVNCENNTAQACFTSCGTYVVGKER